MNDQLSPSQPRDALDDLTEQLLECGGPLSQIVGQMIRHQASGRSAPDAAPIPEVAHTVIRSALGDLGKHHSKRDIKTAARIVQEATKAICDNVFFVPSD